jgi:hypothetical protein
MFRGSGKRVWVADVQWPIGPTRELSLCSEAPFPPPAQRCALTWGRLRLNERSSAKKRHGQSAAPLVAKNSPRRGVRTEPVDAVEGE